MRTNKSMSYRSTTYEGGEATPHQKPEVELERAVATCLLWENTFYETGNDIACRIADLCKKVSPDFVAALAVRARNEYHLRHVPLYLVRQLARLASGRKDGLVRRTLADVIQRPDELMEFLALYWKEKRQPLSAQIKKGLREAFGKFKPYQYAKWNQDGAIKLRDVMFLVAPSGNPDRHRNMGPQNKRGKHEGFTPTMNGFNANMTEREKLYKAIADKTLTAESVGLETWERDLSAGKDKKATFEHLLREKKLGYMALLQNLRNMEQAKVDRNLVEDALLGGATYSKALPFRFVAAARHAPSYAQALSDAMCMALAEAPRLLGRNAVIVDVSGSMFGPKISEKSELDRYDASAALAVLIREVSERCRVFAFADYLEEVPNLRGIGLINTMRDLQRKLCKQGTFLRKSLDQLKESGDYDRVIVLTDEQSHDGITPAWSKHSYLINVAPYRPALDVSKRIDNHEGWTRLSGWSESIVRWIIASENLAQ